MQIRLTKTNADAVERESHAHFKVFKRRRSFSEIVNMMVRDWLCQKSNTIHKRVNFKRNKT